MNKILIDKDNVVSVSNNVLNLDILVSELIINASGKVLINDISSKVNEDLKLTINLDSNSELVYNKFNRVSNLNNEIILNLNDKSTLIFNDSVIATDKSSIKINGNINGSNNKCSINIKGVTENNGCLQIEANGSVIENTIDNDFLENIRILTLNDGENFIIPNLFVSSNEVLVNHNATISPVDKDYMFYLTSKGLSKDKAEYLIKRGYLLNNLQIDKDTKNEIDNLI